MISFSGLGDLVKLRRPRVSAIVSAYASRRFMTGRLENLVLQTLFARGELEIIVIDSCSPEDERSIVESFQARYGSITYLRTDVRETVYGAWNRGVALASGTYIINANSDDRFTLEGLEKMADALDQDPAIDAVYGDWVVTKVENDWFDSPSQKYVFGYPDFIPPLLLFFQITTHAALVRATCFERVGPFEARYKVFGDRDWMLRFAMAGMKARHLPEVVGLYLESPTSVERSNPDSVSEGVELRQTYLCPDLLWRLAGLEKVPSDARQLARLYARVGSLGKHCATLDGVPSSQLGFASHCFARALEQDPLDPVALNNLGIASAIGGDWRHAVEYLSRALPFDDQGEVVHNVQLARSRCQELARYHWRLPEDYYFRDRFHIMVAGGDESELIERTVSYLEAFGADEPVVLTVLAGIRLDHVVAGLVTEIARLGLDQALTPEIRIVPGPAVDAEWAFYLEAADLVMGSQETLERARALGRQTLDLPQREALRAAFVRP